MKLFYKTGTCSLAPNIIMAELGLSYELEAVDLQTKKCASGDYKQINPKGSVPALVLDNGEVLTEGSVICQYLADLKPDAHLMPKFGTFARYRCLEWLNFIATEVHKNFSPLFGLDRIFTTSEGKEQLKSFILTNLHTKLSYVSDKLGSQHYLLGSEFSVADAYLVTCLGWAGFVKLDLSHWPNLVEYQKRVSERPAVMKAMKEQGLI